MHYQQAGVDENNGASPSPHIPAGRFNRWASTGATWRLGQSSGCLHRRSRELDTSGEDREDECQDGATELLEKGAMERARLRGQHRSRQMRRVDTLFSACCCVQVLFVVQAQCLHQYIGPACSGKTKTAACRGDREPSVNGRGEVV